LRLTPRKALSRWFDRQERFECRDATAAERHLVEVHREALAELLIRASRVAYWKAPDMGIVPRRANGAVAFPGFAPSELGARVEARLRAYSKLGCPELEALVKRAPERREALSLASAALALVPSDDARHAVAVATPWDQPATALALLERLAGRARLPDSRTCILSARAARLCALGRLREALDSYQQCRDLSELAAILEYFILNLSCFLEERGAAGTSAQRMKESPWIADFAVEQFQILRAFSRTMTPGQLTRARRTALLHVDGSIAAKTVHEAMS
jgi:hypothetical protein